MTLPITAGNGLSLVWSVFTVACSRSWASRKLDVYRAEIRAIEIGQSLSLIYRNIGRNKYLSIVFGADSFLNFILCNVTTRYKDWGAT